MRGKNEGEKGATEGRGSWGEGETKGRRGEGVARRGGKRPTSEEEDAEAVEEQDPIERQLDRAGDGFAWILRFADRHAHEFSPEIRKYRIDHDGPKREKAPCRALVDIFGKRTGIIPISKPFAIVIGSSAEHEHETQDDNADDDDDFERGQPEFEFAKEADAEVIDEDDGDPEDGDEDARVDTVAVDPVLDDEGSSRELVGRDDDVFEPVPIARVRKVRFSRGVERNHSRVSESESESRVAEAGGIASEAGGEW